MYSSTWRSHFLAESTSTYGGEVAVIPITKGRLVVVDAQDYLWLRQWKWGFQRDPRHSDPGYGYAVRTGRADEERAGRRIAMHREIARTPSELVCDHINGDPLDNRRTNLRNVTQAQNLLNRRVFRSNRAGVKGVAYDARRDKWMAHVRLYFDTREEAEAMYERIAHVTHGALLRGAESTAPEPLSESEKLAIWEAMRERQRARSREMDDYL